MFIVSIFALFVVIFLLSAIVVAIARLTFLKQQVEKSEAAEGESGATGESPPPAPTVGIAIRPEPNSDLFRSERLSSLNFWDNLLARFDFIEILKTRLAQADLNWSIGRLTVAILLSFTVTVLLFAKFLPVWIAFLAGLGVAFAPYGYILRVRRKRFDLFRAGFPDGLDSLSRALRAGYPLSSAMDSAAAEASPIVAMEMRKTSAEANLGMGWNRALENMGRRLPLLEVNLFAAAVQLHARTGGKLGEVITGLAENRREAEALRGEVSALAAHGKLSGSILTILPIVIAAAMMIVSPTYMAILYHHPWGKIMITAAIGGLVTAHFIIRKIVDFEV